MELELIPSEEEASSGDGGRGVEIEDDASARFDDIRVLSELPEDSEEEQEMDEQGLEPRTWGLVAGIEEISQSSQRQREKAARVGGACAEGDTPLFEVRMRVLQGRCGASRRGSFTGRRGSPCLRGSGGGT